MNHTPEEQHLLERMASGYLDGMVGDEREYHCYRKVFCGKAIRNGIPVCYRQSEPSRNPDNGENRSEMTREEELFDTEEKKLEFLQRYGWLMADEEAREYSAKYKPVKKQRKG